MTKNPKIGFVGLGIMGGPMAGHLARAGYSITAFNRSDERAEKWRKVWEGEDLDVSFVSTPAQAARYADLVFTCVGNDSDLAQVTLGDDGVLDIMSSGCLLVDHTTVSADMARRLTYEAGQRGIDCIDAPVSGGEAGAINAQLAIMCGGEDAAMARAEPFMRTYAKSIVHIGPAGAGQTAKMANQMCIAGVLCGLSEAIRLAQGAGLDLEKTYQAISGGAAQSWQMNNRWATMAEDEFDFGFAIDWMRKDLGYALDEASRLGLSSPITALVDQFYAEIQAQGGGRKDTSALITRLPKPNTNQE